MKITDKVWAYFVERLGIDEANRLKHAIENGRFVIISGPHGATGKTTIADILSSIGYDKAMEEWWLDGIKKFNPSAVPREIDTGEFITIRACKPLKSLRAKHDIFEELGIEWKR